MLWTALCHPFYPPVGLGSGQAWLLETIAKQTTVKIRVKTRGRWEWRLVKPFFKAYGFPARPVCEYVSA